MTHKTSPIALALALSCSAGLVQAQPDLRDARNQVQDDLRNSNIGAGYAQMLNFFIDPNVSASRLEADDGTEYDVFKVPLQYEIPINDRGWRVALQGSLSHARAKNTFSVFAGENIDSQWTARSGQIGLGLLVPAGDHLTWMISGQFGISRMESETDYNGPLSEEFLAPVLDGLLFNWETNARIGSLTGGLDYRDRLAERYDLGVAARYTYSRIESYSESDQLLPFSADTGTFSVKANLRHPYSGSIGDRPLFGVAHVGGTAFTGPERKALGFSHFYELGYSVGVDVSKDNRFFESFTLGYQLSIGSDIDGHTLSFGWEFK